jgi:acetyl esterase/lipase
LAALTPNDPTFQPGFEAANTTVQAVAPYYGVYDFTDFENMHEMMLPFLEQFVIKARYADEPERFTAASPISYAHSEAPPFFVLHGDKDPMAPSAQARAFCAALRGAGAATVSYAELSNAHHAFDITPTVRSGLAASAVADFLGVVYGRRDSSLLGSLALTASPAS